MYFEVADLWNEWPFKWSYNNSNIQKKTLSNILTLITIYAICIYVIWNEVNGVIIKNEWGLNKYIYGIVNFKWVINDTLFNKIDYHESLEKNTKKVNSQFYLFIYNKKKTWIYFLHIFKVHELEPKLIEWLMTKSCDEQNCNIFSNKNWAHISITFHLYRCIISHLIMNNE